MLTKPADAVDNVDRARRVVDAPFQRIVYVSTGAVYGDRASTPRRETDEVAAGSEYTAAKLRVEAIVFPDPRCAIARLGNVYGRGMSAHNVLSDLLAQIDTPGPLRVRDLEPVRDYVEVRDVARALVDLVIAKLTGIINIATGTGTSVRSLARMIGARVGQADRAVVTSEPSHARSSLVLDIERARAELGWTPAIALERGLSELVERRVA
jgi:UDP-glucose 4-epimerase